MQRRQFIQALGGASTVGAFSFLAWADTDMVDRIDTPKDAWKGRVSDAAWDVLFREATERPWTSPLNDEKRDGTFICAACYLPLFKADTKYDSGTGWPSFYDYIDGSLAPSTIARAAVGTRAMSSTTGRRRPASGIATTAWRYSLCPRVRNCPSCDPRVGSRIPAPGSQSRITVPSPKNAKKPMTSVTVVSTTLPASAGSMSSFFRISGMAKPAKAAQS